MNCDICSNTITPDLYGWDKGQNAAPIINDGRCCASCNEYLVIPVRLWEISSNKKFKPNEILKVARKLKERKEGKDA